jgi:hypothetical protein
MPRRLATCLGLGLALLYYARSADAAPSLEVSTTLGGADAGEYLVRVANPDAKSESGIIELRHPGDDRAVARTPFEVPAKSTRYFRIPGEKGQRPGAVAITSGETTVRAQERFNNDSSFVVFDIPPRDEQRLHELRVHSGPNAVITHATFDEATKTPVLTRRAAVYEGVALVVVPSRMFLALPAPEREALTTWVRAGGDIALSVSDDADLPRLADLVGDGVKGVKDEHLRVAWSGGRLRRASFGATAELGLGRVHLLPLDVWSTDANGEITVQEKLVDLARSHPVASPLFGDPSWMELPNPSLDPNQGYRSVLALAGMLLVAQALVTALAFRRLALRRGMGAAYRFVAGSSAVTFAAVIGLGLYAKGGFGARARELSFVDAASGETVGRVERTRAYFASDTRSIEVSPRDASNLLDSRAHDSRAVVRVDDGNRGKVVLGDVRVRPWQTTAVTERGTTTLGGGVRIASENGKITVQNATGATLRNVVVARPEGTCLAFGEIANGQESSAGTPLSCTDLGPAWATYRGAHRSPEDYAVTPTRLTLLGQLEEGPTSMDGFRVEKRTTLLRVTGGDS